MRIAHCILQPRYSGAEMLVLGLVRAQIGAGFGAAIIALQPSEVLFERELEALEKLGCRMFVPQKRLVRHQRLLWIRRATRDFRPDVLFAHTVLPSVYCRVALIGVSRVRVVSVLHADADFENRGLRAAERLIWSRNAAIVGVSAAALRNYSRLITAKMKTCLIPNGIDLKDIRSAAAGRDEVRKHIYQAAPDEVILLQVGRISTTKQQRLSVEALGALAAMMSLKNVRMVFAGMIEFPEYHQEVLAAARALGVSEKIQFWGSRGDIPLLLAGADAHLMPSGWEAQGIVALEALASGVLSFFTPLEAFLPFGGMPGVVILPEQASGKQFAALLAEAIRTSAAARRYVRDLENFSFERCAREYLRLAESLVPKNGPIGGNASDQ